MKHCHDIIININININSINCSILNHCTMYKFPKRIYSICVAVVSPLRCFFFFVCFASLIWFSVYPISIHAHTDGLGLAHDHHTASQYELRCVYGIWCCIRFPYMVTNLDRRSHFHGSQQTEHCVAILVQHRYAFTLKRIHTYTNEYKRNIAWHTIIHSNSKKPNRLNKKGNNVYKTRERRKKNKKK